MDKQIETGMGENDVSQPFFGRKKNGNIQEESQR
jgi:hypothetical protein